MNKLTFATLAALSSAIVVPCFAAENRKPNIVFIIADDLGYNELGCYGQKKIKTPNIDKLAQQGMRFTNHYSGNAVCAPSRCVLMTGFHPGHAVVRNNKEMKPEGQYPLPADAVTVAKLLKQQGYATGAFGKWGLGFPGSTGEPLKQGFDRFFGYNCQAKAHTFYPQELWDNDKIVKLDNPPMPRVEKLPAGADPNSTESYKKYMGKQYSADVINEKAREFVRENKDKPFFLFVPTTVPHLALQVPEDSLAEYRGLWPDQPYTGDKGYVPQMYPRAAYAAMITRMDKEVGRLVQLVEELGLTKDTIFVFTSDNGTTHDNTGGVDPEFFQSVNGFRGLKGSLYEGGVKVPLIVKWPGRIANGSTCDRVTGFEDWMPTLLELAGAKETVPPKIDGVSFVGALDGKKLPERPFLYREFPAYGGQQSLRVGDWKLVRQNLSPTKKNADSTTTQELFNLKTDPFEQHDISKTEPSRVVELEKIMKEQHVPSRVFRMPALDGSATDQSSEE